MQAADWLREYRSVMSRVAIREEDCDEAVLRHHLPFLERLDAVDGSSVALYDLRSRSYRFLTSSFRFLGGYPRDEALAEGPDYFFRLMHAPDLAFSLETITRTFGFLFSLPAAERKDYRLSFEFRIKAASGALVRILQQVVALELDARGNIWLVLIANDLAPRGSLDAEPERRLVNVRTGAWYLFPPGERSDARAGSRAGGGAGGAGSAGGGGQAGGGLGGERQSLSRREIEVLGLVASGLASKEIADSLFISVATVNNHRQRILGKLGTRTSAEAVRYAAALGLV